MSNRKDFQRAADIVRGFLTGDKDDQLNGPLVRKVFIRLFRLSPSFDEDKFRDLCEPSFLEKLMMNDEKVYQQVASQMQQGVKSAMKLDKAKVGDKIVVHYRKTRRAKKTIAVVATVVAATGKRRA